MFRLFLTFFKIGLFTFGGGYAMLPLLQDEIVRRNRWASDEELMDYYSVGQCTPGIIAVNVATFIGYKLHGWFGSVMATVAIILPSFIIMLILAKLMSRFKDNPYVESVMKYLRLVVVGLIAAAALLLVTPESFGENCADWRSWIIFIVAFAATKWLKMHPILMICVAAVVGIIIY